MGRVSRVQFQEQSVAPFPECLGSAHGDVVSRPVVASQEGPIHMWGHELAEGASISLSASAVDHLLYVWRGATLAGHDALGEQGLVIVERGAALHVTATARAVLLHFFRAEDQPAEPARAGGRVHRVPPGTAPRGMDEQGVVHTLFAGSDCPTCELWFHRSDLPAAIDVPRHYHTEDEIIFVVSGSMLLGRRELREGAALAIGEGTVYRFRSGPKGLGFLNFRTSSPRAVLVDQGIAPIDEGQYLRGLIRNTAANAR